MKAIMTKLAGFRAGMRMACVAAFLLLTASANAMTNYTWTGASTNENTWVAENWDTPPNV